MIQPEPRSGGWNPIGVLSLVEEVAGIVTNRAAERRHDVSPGRKPLVELGAGNE